MTLRIALVVLSVATMAAFGLFTQTAHADPAQFEVRENGDGRVWMQNKGDAVTINNVIANRGSCIAIGLAREVRTIDVPAWLAFTPTRLAFGEDMQVRFVESKDFTDGMRNGLDPANPQGVCGLLEVELVTTSGNLVFSCQFPGRFRTILGEFMPCERQ